jgi:hypothetical protein
VANSLLTINMITREAIKLFRNSNAFIMEIDRQYDDSFAKTGAKIGTTLRIRLPNDYTVRTGPAAQVQDTAEVSTTLALATQQGVDLSFSTVDRTMNLDDYSSRILAPAVNNLGGAVAQTIMNGAEGGAANIAGVVAGGLPQNPSTATILNARTQLMNNSAPSGNRKLVTSPGSNANIVALLGGLFNPQTTISKQYASGKMQEALGFDFMEDQTVLNHTTGTLAQASATVNGAGQTGMALVVNALAGSLAQGDIITVAGVQSVNRITKATQAQLRTFVVTAPVAAGATSIPIYPAIVAPITPGVPVQFQTVTASPANGAAVNLALGLGPSVTYTKNLAFVPEAITMATADLELPRGVHEAYVEEFDDISMRIITAYDIATDQMITRLDILYGFLYIRPEWAVCLIDIPS